MAQSFRPCSTTLPECVCPAPPPRLRPESSRTRPTPPRPALGCCRISPPPDPEWEEGRQERMRGETGIIGKDPSTADPAAPDRRARGNIQSSTGQSGQTSMPSAPTENSLSEFFVFGSKKKTVCSAAGRQIFGWRAFM